MSTPKELRAFAEEIFSEINKSKAEHEKLRANVPHTIKEVKKYGERCEELKLYIATLIWTVDNISREIGQLEAGDIAKHNAEVARERRREEIEKARASGQHQLHPEVSRRVRQIQKELFPQNTDGTFRRIPN